MSYNKMKRFIHVFEPCQIIQLKDLSLLPIILLQEKMNINKQPYKLQFKPGINNNMDSQGRKNE